MKKRIIFIVMFMFLCNFFYSEEKYKAINVNYGKFGIMDNILNSFLVEYPTVSGDGIGITIKRYGDKGIKSTYYSTYSLRFFEFRGGGIWRESNDDYKIKGKLKLKQISFSYSVILNIFPSFVVTPYLGLGIGAGVAVLNAEGHYRDKWEKKDELYKYQALIPIVKIPVGISIRPKNDIELDIQGGFENGFYISWGISYNFQ